MSEVHVEEHESLIKTPQQLIVVVLLAFAVPVIGIIMIASFVTGGLNVDGKGGEARPEAVAQRLKPVATLTIGEPAVQPQAATAVAGVKTAGGQPVKAGGADAGKQLYDTVCTACHGAGIAGAPKAGDKAAWKARIAQGKATLYEHALKGKGAMPPKGGSTAPDADVKAAVDYLVGLAK
ncbi:MAG TPA: c-type cytochrome [Burkholderiales bacterium]|nr:c-type cytochrome [Burkholderiales bacterium]